MPDMPDIEGMALIVGDVEGDTGMDMEGSMDGEVLVDGEVDDGDGDAELLEPQAPREPDARPQNPRQHVARRLPTVRGGQYVLGSAIGRRSWRSRWPGTDQGGAENPMVGASWVRLGSIGRSGPRGRRTVRCCRR